MLETKRLSKGTVLIRLADRNADKQIIKKFKDKYDRDIATDEHNSTLLEIHVTNLSIQKS